MFVPTIGTRPEKLIRSLVALANTFELKSSEEEEEEECQLMVSDEVR